MPRLTVALLALGLVAATPAPTPEAVRRDAREIFATLVGMETSVGKGEVPKAAEYLAERFRRAGFPAADVRVLPVGETAALVVRYRGAGGGRRPIALLSHLDVVTAKREDWQLDPFTLTERDGYFFGRGTRDIKSEVAVLAETFIRLRTTGYVPARDLVLILTGDEETTGATAADLILHHRDLVDAEYALNGDGGGGELAESDGKPILHAVQGAEKTSATYRLTVRNPGGHSSRPRPDNAIYELADALERLRRCEFPVMWNDWTLGDFRVSAPRTPGAMGEALRRFAAHPGDADAARVIAADPGRVGQLRTTCVATMLEGGHAENALPQSATATVNCRIFPGTGAHAVEDTLRQLVGPGVEVALSYEPLEADASPMRADVMAAVTRAVGQYFPGAAVGGTMAAYATDGAVFRRAGIPTYGVSGLFEKPSDFFAHGLNERIPVASFYADLGYWYTLIRDLAGGR